MHRKPDTSTEILKKFYEAKNETTSPEILNVLDSIALSISTDLASVTAFINTVEIGANQVTMASLQFQTLREAYDLSLVLLNQSYSLEHIRQGHVFLSLYYSQRADVYLRGVDNKTAAFEQTKLCRWLTSGKSNTNKGVLTNLLAYSDDHINVAEDISHAMLSARPS